MAQLGVLFSLEENEIVKLKSFESDEDRLQYLQEEIEEPYFENHEDRVAELDKSWDALHRSLTDGNLEYSNGTFPLSHVVLGGDVIYTSGDYIMTVKTPHEVKRISEEIYKIDKEFLRGMYYKIDANNYGFPLTEDDFDYTWTWLEASREFWKLAAIENRYVLFTVDQ